MARLMACAGVVLVMWWGVAAAQPPQTGDRGAAQVATAQLTSRTCKVAIQFDRNSLQGALEKISEQIDVPIELIEDDFRRNGITGCQSFGLSEPEQPVEQLLQKLLHKADPDHRFVYTVKPNSVGVATVYIGVRREAEKRGDELFPEFAIGRKQPAPSPRTRWASLIRATVLENEVRAQIEVLDESLKSESLHQATQAVVGQLAALFYLIEQYDGEVRWKSEARVVRDAVVRARPARAPWDETERRRLTKLRDDLQQLLVGDVWSRAAEPSGTLKWSQVAARSALMRRLESGYLGQLIKSPDDKQAGLLADGTAVGHDAEVITALARVIQDSSYEFADDREYMRCAKMLELQARAVGEAAAKGDLTGLKLEIGRLQKSCDDCHGGYR